MISELIEFINNNYLILCIIAVIIILSLVGYIVDHRTRKDIKIKKKPIQKEETEEEEIEGL